METYGLEKLGIINAGAVYRNLTPAQLVEHALRRGGHPVQHRSPGGQNREVHRPQRQRQVHCGHPAVHDDIAWGKVNRPMDKARFDAIYAKVTAYLQNKDVFISTASPERTKYTKAFRIVNELASQNLFIHQLLRSGGPAGNSMRITPSSPPPASSAFLRWTAPARGCRSGGL